MDTTNILGLSGFGISILGVVYTAINHKRIRSRCCGKVLEASIDVENTTPIQDAHAQTPVSNGAQPGR
jgi:hypothetical protein